MTGANKRSVERDYNYYDPPEIIRKKIESPGSYGRSSQRLELRDKALMSLMYIAAARVTEITGGITNGGELPGVSADQFYFTPEFIYLRGLKNVKKKFIKVGDSWQPITNWRQYPNRVEIPIPRQGGLSWIGTHIENYLNDLKPRRDMFKISPTRSYQIVKQKTGEFNHYFRSMGTKLWYILLDRNAFRLKEFTGHTRWSSLESYMRDISTAQNNMLAWRES